MATCIDADLAFGCDELCESLQAGMEILIKFISTTGQIICL